MTFYHIKIYTPNKKTTPCLVSRLKLTSVMFQMGSAQNQGQVLQGTFFAFKSQIQSISLQWCVSLFKLAVTPAYSDLFHQRPSYLPWYLTRLARMRLGGTILCPW